MARLLTLLASWIIRILCLTWRVRLIGPEPIYSHRPLIFCFWHGKQSGLFAHPRLRTMAVLTSLSRDGALQSSILKRLGFRVLRGSSSRGGAAGLKAIIGAIGKGDDAAFAVDGPRGPYHRVKAGAIFAAEETGGYLLPITFRASSSWTFQKAWDKYQLPKPFARVELIRGEAIVPVRGELNRSRLALEQALLGLENGG